MIPDNITKEHLAKAIEEIDRNGVQKGRHSSTYDLIHNGKSYPPKLVISIANKYSNGSELNPNDFSGGKDTKAFELLKNEGFIIKEKTPLIDLISDFLQQSKTDNLKTKQYLKSYKGLKVKVSFGAGVSARIPWIGLYKEPNKITKGIYPVFLYFKEYNKLVLAYGISETEQVAYNWYNTEKLQSIEEWYLKEFKKKPDRYGSSLIKGIYDIEKGIDNDSLTKDLEELIADYENIDFSNMPNYWVFQGNPKIFDTVRAIENNALETWSVHAHKTNIKVGDKVILWMTGKDSGCYALAEVTSKLFHSPEISNEKTYYAQAPGDKLTSDKVKIKITHDLTKRPVLKTEIKTDSLFDNFKGGNQGTNFSATKSEYNSILYWREMKNKQYWLYSPGENARNWEEFYKYGIIGLGWDEIGDLKQYQTYDEIKSALVKAYGGKGSKKNDVLANDDFLNNINIGDIIIAKKGRGELLGYGVVTSNYEYDSNRSEYRKVRHVDWKLKGNWKVDHSLVLKTLTDITKYYSDDTKTLTYYDELLNIMGHKIINDSEKMNFPLNTILYGPPGTGKTYNTILRAAQIIENRAINSYDEALEIFKANLHDKIEFITFHQNYSYEDFIQGLRPDTENDNQLTFERKDGVFKEIADRALKNLIESEKPQLLKRPFEEVFNQFINPLIEGEIEEIEVKMKKVSYFITATSNKSIDFRKASGGTAHTLSIRTLKKMYLAESILEIQGLATYYTPLLAELLKLGKDSSGKKEQIKRQDYVIIIDEINRANISRVFGELITLIEPDKRSHGAIPLEARLPSGDPFIVPSNLFIIGTMNTADKSIALLDIALRRRFEFESMYPKYEIEGQEIYDVEILEKINKQIIKSKGHDFQIGHAYFMGDNKDLVQRMNKKVIPLLLEYYMNDEKEIKGILNSAGLVIEENSWPLKISGKND